MDEPLSEEEKEVLQRVAERIVRVRLAVPAIFFLESTRPLNFLGSQALHFFNPLLSIFFRFRDVERLAEILEKRASIGVLLDRLEETESLRAKAEREKRALRRTRRREERARKAASRGEGRP